jgi:hypothetical protein
MDKIIKGSVAVKYDPFTGYAYVIEGEDLILARSNSEAIAAEIADAINDNAALRARLAEAEALLKPFASPGNYTVADLRRAAAFLARKD